MQNGGLPPATVDRVFTSRCAHAGPRDCSETRVPDSPSPASPLRPGVTTADPSSVVGPSSVLNCVLNCREGWKSDEHRRTGIARGFTFHPPRSPLVQGGKIVVSPFTSLGPSLYKGGSYPLLFEPLSSSPFFPSALCTPCSALCTLHSALCTLHSSSSNEEARMTSRTFVRALSSVGRLSSSSFELRHSFVLGYFELRHSHSHS